MLNAFVAATTMIATLLAASASLSAEFKELTGDPPPLETDVSNGMKKLHQSAVEGDAEKQADLGRAYLFGEGVPRNVAKALYWLRLASKPVPNGSVFILLNCILIKTGDPKLMAEGGAAFVAQMEKLKDSKSRIEISKLYRFGIGVPQDHHRADTLVAEAGDILREQNFSGPRGWNQVAHKLESDLLSGSCVGPDLLTAHRIRNAAGDLPDDSKEPDPRRHFLPHPMQGAP